MTSPWHQHASVPLFESPSVIHERLVADPTEVVATATGLALAGLEPLVRSWGLPPSALPGVTARPTGADEVGAVELRWSGDEDATAWPSLVARLMVVPDAPASSARLVFLTPRSPGAELTTRRVGRVHRERILDTAIQRFLREVAVQLRQAGTTSTTAPVTQFDRRPIFVHHLEPLPQDPTTLARHLIEGAHVLASEVATAALEAARAPLTAGRFRQPPSPTSHVALTPPGTTGVLDLGWTSDEEATGWPQLTLTLAVEAAADSSSRLVILSRRKPGYDLTTNRVEKRARDQILRELGSHVATAIADRLPPTIVSSTGADTAGRELART